MSRATDELLDRVMTMGTTTPSPELVRAMEAAGGLTPEDYVALAIYALDQAGVKPDRLRAAISIAIVR